MAATSEADNVLGLSKKDLSLLRHSLEAGGKLIHQVIDGLKHGTSEVQQLILQQSDVILECRVCRNLFRSLPNYLDHKRLYCCELFPNESLSLLAIPFADEVPIIYPEPPDDAKEFVEMSDLISKFNQKKHFEPNNEAPDTSPKTKAYVPNLRESIGGTLERSCQRGKPLPLYLKAIKGTKIAMQLVPLRTDNDSENRNQAVFAGNEKIKYKKRQKKMCTSEHRSVGLSLIKWADFHKLLCLKCNQTYTNKKRLAHHIKRFHVKKCGNCKENETCIKKTKAENNNSGSSRQKKDFANKNEGFSTKSGKETCINKTKAEINSRKSRQKKGFEKKKKNDLEEFSTKSGLPSLKKFSYLAKKSTLVQNTDLKNGWCHICNHSYSGKRGLVFHMLRMHSGCRKIYPCPFCNVKFPSLASALRHTQTVHSCKKNNMKHVRKQLKESGHVENQQLKNMLEPEIKVNKCDSQISKLVAPSLGSLSDPVEMEEDDNDNLTDSKSSLENSKFKCQKCYQVFVSIRGLSHHITRKHRAKKQKNKPSYTCHICLMVFYTHFGLKKHHRLKHNIEENVQENTANSTEIQSKSDLNEVETEPVSCEGTSEYLLDKSIIVYNNKKYRIPKKYYKTVCKFASFPSLCLDCKQKFTNEPQLIRHIIRIHCTYKNAFPCPFCHLQFISSVSILRHTKVQHSCSDEKIAELNRKLHVWEQQKKKNLGLKIRKQTENNVSSEATDNEVQNEDSLQKEPLTIHDVTDFQTSKCLNCKQSFAGLQGLMLHIGKAHSMLSDQKHKCLECNESFDTVFIIMKHMENIHNLVYKPQKLYQQKINTSFGVGETARSSSPAPPPLPPPEAVQPVESPEEKEKKLDPCKFEQTYGEDAPNSQLVMQCADLIKSHCLRCSEIFTGNRALIAHIYKEHARHSQTYSCYICLHTFTSFAIASRHTRNSHVYKGSAMMHVRIDNISGETSAGK